MKMQSKWLWVPALAAVLTIVPIAEVSAHRAAEGAGMQARGICGAQARRHVSSRVRSDRADPALLALRDLVALECLYRRQGKNEQVEALYRDVLEKSTQPQLRSIAYRRLARMAWRKGEQGTAEELLKRSLQENLK